MLELAPDCFKRSHLLANDAQHGYNKDSRGEGDNDPHGDVL